MAIQRRADSPSEADSYERATAFLSGWIEDSLLVPNAKATHQPHHHRPFSPSMPDLPSGTLRRRSTVSNGDNIESLVNSLRTTLMQHQNHRPSHHGITLDTSPSCVRAVLHKESSSRRGGGGGIPPLPFSEGGEEPQQPPTSSSRSPPHQRPLNRDHQQGVVAPSVGSAAAAALRSTSGSRYVTCSFIRRCSSAGERRRSAKDITEKSSQSEDVKNKHGSKHPNSKQTQSSKKSPYTRRHSIDCDRSLTSSGDNCASIDQPNQAKESLRSPSMGSLNEHQRRTSSRRRVHWPDPSDDDLLGDEPHQGASGKKEDPRTMVVSLPWTDHAGNVGYYTGQVNSLIQPHGSGALQYDHGAVVKGVWNNGNPTTIASSPVSSPVPSPVVEKEVIKGAVTVEAVKRKGANEKKSSSNHPSYRPTRSKSSRSKQSKPAVEGPSTAATPSSSTHSPTRSPLDRLSDLDGPPNFDLGDTFHSPKYQIIESNPTKALDLVNQLRTHDFAWILRSSREWTYSIVADFPVEEGEEKSIRFVIDKLGNTKTLKMKHWAKCIRLVDQKSH